MGYILTGGSYLLEKYLPILEQKLAGFPDQVYLILLKQYHCILENAFDFLMQIAASNIDDSIAKQLFKMTEQNWILLNKGNRFYEESWLNLLGDLAAYPQSAHDVHPNSK